MADIIVSGAGTTTVNGTFTERGSVNGYPYYNLLGEVDSTTVYVIKHDPTGLGSRWRIYGPAGDDEYIASSAGAQATPDLVPAWSVWWGMAPVPTVTASSGGGSTNKGFFAFLRKLIDAAMQTLRPAWQW